MSDKFNGMFDELGPVNAWKIKKKGKTTEINDNNLHPPITFLVDEFDSSKRLTFQPSQGTSWMPSKKMGRIA